MFVDFCVEWVEICGFICFDGVVMFVIGLYGYFYVSVIVKDKDVCVVVMGLGYEKG